MLNVTIITLAINCVYTYKIRNLGETGKFNYVPKEIDICNLGSSHGVHGYYYADIEDEYSCFNFALDSQLLSYDKRVLDYYQDNLTEGAVVIIDISFFACYGQDETLYDSFESKNKRYYHFLPPYLIKNYDIYTDIMGDKLRSLSAGLSVVVETIFAPADLSEVKSYPDSLDIVDEKDIDADTKAACQRHIYDGKRDESNSLIYNEEEIQALYDIVNICRKHNATPILVTVPYLKEYTDAIGNADPQFYNEFYKWVSSVVNDLNVEYFDYSLDERFIYDYNLFYNGDHMNSYGARKFTNILFDEVIYDRLKAKQYG